MSAIAGIYNLNEEPVNIEHINLVMKSFREYPADDVQVWHQEHIFFGCHAQWITPESIGERLPYYDSERQVAIAADAIIDNRNELFDQLQVERSLRSGITDSELILLAYHKWGEEAPAYLAGDFAFMIWDGSKRQLFGARDPSGYRPLYYCWKQSRFTFGTTIESLLALPNMDRQLNEHWIAQFLAITGMIDTVDACMTPYRNIEQVPPFHTILIGEGKLKLAKYGRFYPERQLKLKSEDEYVEAFQEVFRKAVTARLRTHRKIGSQLSGGLDSGTVVGFAARALREQNQTLHTFSYIPPSDFVDFTPKQVMPDERPFIQKTVKHVGGISDHYCAFEGRSSYSEIDDFLDVMEMPYKFFENSFWLKGVFEKAYEEGVGVLLNGDRGNFTISWGSALDYYAVLLKKFKWLRLYQELNHYSSKMGAARLRNLPLIAQIGFPNIYRMLSPRAPENPPMLINPEFAERTGVFRKLKKVNIDQTGWFDKADAYEQRRITFEEIYPWNSGNALTSKLSLRYPLWKRDPTNDIRVVRFCLSVPEEQCVRNGMDRALVRRSTATYLPDEVRLNQRVRGMQGADWVHRMIPHWNDFIEEAKQLSQDPRMMEFMNGQAIRPALAKAGEGARKEYVTDPDYRILMRSLIVGRFIKKFA